jgi:4-alpha-glucanotransferase
VSKLRKTDPWGIDQSYQNGREEWHEVSDETKQKLAQAMRTGGAAGPPEPRLRIVTQGKPTQSDASAELVLEDGTVLPLEKQLPPDVPLGYHTLRSRQNGEETRLIVVPQQCFLPKDFHIWGWALQLYSLRSAKSWGIGDFGDLRRFSNWMTEKLGAQVVMTNPLDAAGPGVPQQASPYSPTSRIYRNMLFLRIGEIDGARESASSLEQFEREGAALNRLPLIDRDKIYQLKMAALDAIWQKTRERVDISEYEKQEGEHLDRFAVYCALAETHGANWRQWPKELTNPQNEAVKHATAAAEDRVRFHKWIQWLLEQQLSQACDRHPVLMQDLPIGVDPSGADAWALQDLFAQGVSVGAPPDIFNTQGQDWGLQPFIPYRLRNANYEPFVRIIRANMRHSAGLRIDHVMGLFRLFWIPEGAEKVNGTYVHYRPDEMLAILALESARAKAFVVGEDLGTVEEGVREAMAERGVLSYKVMWFEADHPRTYIPNALAAVTTHDLPTVAGLWSGADLKEQDGMGLNPNVEGTEESRVSLRKLTETEDGTPVSEVVLRAYEALAEAPSAVVITAMEDALLMEKRPNLPGTLSEQRPNWAMPLTKSLEEIEQDPFIQELAARIEKGRSKNISGKSAATSSRH